MAKLAKLPSGVIISGFKGTVDFYVHRGIPCARAWPRAPTGPRAPGVVAAQLPFTEAVRLWNTLSTDIKEAYNSFATTTNLTGRDWFIRGYISGIFKKPLP